MGANKSHIVNETGETQRVLIFTCKNIGYWTFSDFRQPPADKRPITVKSRITDVEVGVVINESEGWLFYDLFKLKKGATLTIREVTTSSGVTRYDGDGVELLKLGASVQNSCDSALKQNLKNIKTFAKGVTHTTDVAQMAAAAASGT